MKKIIAIAAMLIMTATAVKAQFGIGLKGGLNVTSMSLDSKVFDATNQCGFYVGPTVKFSLPVVGLGFDISALYNQRTSKLEGGVADAKGSQTIKHQSVSIPLNLRYQLFGLGDQAGLFVFTGPQVDFNIGDKNLIDNLQDWRFKDSDFSWNIGLGVMVLNHLQINANYNIGLSKTSEMSDVMSTAGALLGIKDTKENTWQVGVAYFF